MEEFRRALGSAIRTTRMARGLTLRDLATRCGDALRATSIGGYERGERALTVERLALLARALGVAADTLVAEALAIADPIGYREVSLRLDELPSGEVGLAAAAHVREIREARGDLVSPVITLRRGDLERVAASANLTLEQTIGELGPAVLPVSPAISRVPST